MKDTRLIMGMPVTVEILDEGNVKKDIEDIFSFFVAIDNRFSTYKKDSEISAINAGKILLKDASLEMQEVFALSEQTKQQTNGYFDIKKNKTYDPSGLVKGWAIFNASQKLLSKGYKNFYVEIGGDIQVSGKKQGEKWKIGIRNPFDRERIIKTICLEAQGIATSGTYIRGQHIYNPFKNTKEITDIVSLTVIGPNIYEADRFATAAFSMGKKGIEFIAGLEGFEGYMIDADGIATFTTGFETYVC
ncbi:MAG TPA: FAD:protein FMN transferase [Patescibacteria group bacterium]|nr:FAD:protein FMN transferase [Patescibacteria group bacterium]